MKLFTLGTAAVETGETPFATGFNCVAANFTAADIDITGSDDNSTFTALVTVPAGGMIEIDALPRYIKASAASAYLIQ